MLYSLFIIASIGFAAYLLYKQAALSVWTISFALFSALLFKYGEPGYFTQFSLVLVLALFSLNLIRPLRRLLISRHLFKLVAKAVPSMSATEREALEAGTVTWEGDLFSGAPDFKRLRNAPTVELTDEEQAFMNGPVNELCRMLDDWDITHNRTDMPEEVWSFIKKNGFLGMIIPKKFGGLEFSASAQMSILVKIYGRSITAATSISVPNSLGPGELLLKYGTEEQKNYYLPRLADGREIPCFALTGPNAGSDAASIPDTGIVCKQMFNGKETVGIKLNWNKRYITLCPVATVVGLAFRLFDPDNLIGETSDIGITLALIPSDTPGVVKGRRHFPLNTAFLNGPTEGKDVFISLDYLIGGVDRAGQGWRMLMECLSAGRAISLPSSASGGTQLLAMVSGAYARIRKQFGQSISKFEGIEEPLARIGGNTYIIDSALTMAAAAIDQGEKPSVAGAILKYHTTERGRQAVIDSMDIHGGKGICLGPNNYIGRGYQSAPISITVEGANILTRNLIIFGQGAIRCHPYVFKELESIRTNDLKAFDQAFFAHAGFVLSNFFKSLIFAVTDGYGSKAPASRVHRYYQLVHRYSTNLAFMADFSMAVMGGDLKRRERISARLGDMLSTLYLCSAVLKRYYEDHEPEADLPLVQWCCDQLMFECEQAMQGVIRNYRIAWARVFLKLVIRPFGLRRNQPHDKLSHKVATLMSQPCETRDRLTRLAFKEPLDNCPAGRLEQAFLLVTSTSELEKKVLKAVKDGQITSLSFMDQIKEAADAALISEVEKELLLEAEHARQDIIAVDDFSTDELQRSHTQDKTLKSVDKKVAAY